MRTHCREVMSDQGIDNVVQQVAQKNDQLRGELGRADDRAIRKIASGIRSSVETMILQAKTLAQVKVFADATENPDDIRNRINREYTNYSMGREKPDRPARVVAADIWVKTFDLEEHIAQTEYEILEKTETFFTDNTDNIVYLLDYLSRDDTDLDEHRPLLVVLAKQMFDPKARDIIGRHLADLLQQPDRYIPVFCQQLEQQMLIPEEAAPEAGSFVSPDDIGWLKFVRSQFLGTDSLQSMLGDIPFTEWPGSLQASLRKDYDNFLGTIQQRYKDLLRPYEDKRTFFIAADALAARVDDGLQNGTVVRTNGTKPSKRNAKKHNGRTTPKSASANIKRGTEQEENSKFRVHAIEEWSPTVLRPGFHGHARTDRLEFTNDTELTTLLAIGKVKSYLKEYDNDPRLQADLIEMLVSLLQEPYGNGATKIPQIKINLADEHGKLKPHRLWHLNPNDRSQTIGNIARDTRIYYVVRTDEETHEKSLVLLRIGNKKTMAKLRSKIYI